MKQPRNRCFWFSFGNGAPDVFSSLAAFVGSHASIGVSAILGAGVFVTMVVVAGVALASEAKLNRRPFLRDVISYIIAVVYLLIIFLDRTVTVPEAIGFIMIYVAFAVVVVAGRVVYQKKKKRRLKAFKAQKEKEAPLLDTVEESEMDEEGSDVEEDGGAGPIVISPANHLRDQEEKSRDGDSLPSPIVASATTPFAYPIGIPKAEPAALNRPRALSAEWLMSASEGRAGASPLIKPHESPSAAPSYSFAIPTP